MSIDISLSVNIRTMEKGGVVKITWNLAAGCRLRPTLWDESLPFCSQYVMRTLRSTVSQFP